ncbi:helix-turn-helix domain protein [Mycobacterium xenopi 3993]|nr:helix-turn-helix domain protein [Mycobacterium xenopi 3993]
MAVGDDEAKVRAERARAIGLFRYQLIREAADPAHSTKERGKMVRELASREHTDPFGRKVRISRQTLDRWIRDWRAGGFDALVPNPRQCTPAPRGGARTRGGAAPGEPGPHRRGDPADPAHPAGLGTR